MRRERHPPRRRARSQSAAGSYVLVVRGSDGRARVERFDDAAAYRARLMSLERSPAASLSIEDIVRLLDA